MKITLALLSALFAATGQVALGAAAHSAGTGNWEGMGGGMNGSVNSLAVYHGQLIAAGGFTTASDHAADRIARWTGTEWAPFPGGGADGGIEFVVAFRDWLIIAGRFDSVGGVAADGLARWDGAQWWPIPDNHFAFVDALTVYSNTLVVGGLSVAEGAMEHIAAWDGSSWSALAGGLDDTPNALGVHAGSLFVSAHLPWPETGDAIWRWDGTAWSIFEDQLDDTVYAYGDDHGTLVAAGWFGSIGGASHNRIAAWNGTDWEDLGAGIGSSLPNQRVDALATYNGDLWAGGFFERAGGEDASNIATWSDGIWSSPGAGADYTVSAFTTYGGSLVAAGSFAVIDGETVNYVARWTQDFVFSGTFEKP
jgi:hypothetical protein